MANWLLVIKTIVTKTIDEKGKKSQMTKQFCYPQHRP